MLHIVKEKFVLIVDLYTEITCPWCIIGQHRLDNVLERQFPNIEVDIVHHPILLMPDAPEEGLYIPDLLFKRYGIADTKSAFARPEAEARASGLDLDLSSQPWAYRTQPAHALISAARAKGTQHKLAVAISDAYFLRRMKISDTDVLVGIAKDFGFEPHEARFVANSSEQQRQVELEASLAGAKGIRSVPHFVFGGRVSINGGRSEDEIADAIRQSTFLT